MSSRGDSPTHDAAILVFTRSPSRESQAKALGRVGGASAARALLTHTLAVAHGARADVVVVGDHPTTRALYGVEQVLLQRGSTFGSRLRNAVADVFALGYRRVVVVGTDTPGLSTALCQRALDELSGDPGTVVLGPARDGGYYLIGLNGFDERAFAGIPWRTRHVRARTRRALRGARISSLPELTDVDDEGSLRASLLEAAPGPTRRYLRRIVSACRRLTTTRATPALLPALAPTLLPARRGPPPRAAR